jgi:hypothetical protein
MAASLLPLISELLPMIMPSSTQIVRAKDIQPQHPTVEGPAVERPVIFDKGGLSANVLTVRPSSHSTIRHNSEQGKPFIFLIDHLATTKDIVLRCDAVPRLRIRRLIRQGKLGRDTSEARTLTRRLCFPPCLDRASGAE